MQGRQPSATSQRLQQSEARRNPARATRTSISRIWKADHVLVATRCHNIDLPIVGALCPNIDLPIVLIANIDERGLIREMGNVVSLEKKRDAIYYDGDDASDQDGDQDGTQTPI